MRITVGRELPALVLLAVIGWGAAVRFADLGGAQLNIDEATQLFVADALAEGRGPVLPSGEEYRRGIDLTRAIGLSRAWVSDPELAARLPAALFGVVNLVLFAVVCWQIAGGWAAVWAVLLLASFPELVVQSRTARFYTYQLCFTIPALYTAWRWVQGFDLRWMVATGALLLGARVQVTSLSVAVGVGVAAAGLALLRARDDREPLGPTAQVVGLGVGALAAVAVRSDLLADAFFVPLWAGDGGSPLAYHRMLTDAVPLLWSLAPVAFAVAWARSPALGWLLACWFGIPLLLHSFVLPWKGDRFLLAAMPGLFLAGGIAASAGFRALALFAYGSLLRANLTSRHAALMAGGAGALASAFLVGTTPAIHRAGRIASDSHLDWGAAAQRMNRAIGALHLPLETPVGSTMPLPALFYWTRLDFTVGREFLEETVEGVALAREVGAIDSYSGRPVLSTGVAIRRAYLGKAPAVFIAVDPNQIAANNVDPVLLEVLRTDGTELCGDQCGGLLVYLWTLGETPAEPSA